MDTSSELHLAVLGQNLTQNIMDRSTKLDDLAVLVRNAKLSFTINLQ